MTRDDGCTGCGAPAPAGARFCMVCGAALAGVAGSEVRKTVTALFCDVVGSTELGRRQDLEVHRRRMENWFAGVAAVLARHGGTVEKYAGDAVLAVFGVPLNHDDDALRACRAALDLLALEGLPVRVGLETGEVVVGDLARGSTFVSGPAINVAARLQAVAAPGQVLLGPDCHRVVRDQVVSDLQAPRRLNGIDGPVVAHALRGLAPRRDVVPRGPLFGRTTELSLLHQMLDRASQDGTCQVVTVLGVAGLGKTRLSVEFLPVVEGGARVLRGRCLPYGDGVTWWPLVEVLRQVAGLSGDEDPDVGRGRLLDALGDAPDASEVATRLASVAGLGGGAPDHQDVAWAFRRLLEELGRDRTVVLAIDDLHWAEPSLLAVLDEALRRVHGPVMSLSLARPDLLDVRPEWGAGFSNSLTLRLEPLATGDVSELAADAAGADLEPAAAERIGEVTGGNPLFVEQLVRMLVDEGSLELGPAGWRLVRAELDVPPTVAALIDARLDRLAPVERMVLGAAAVIGQVFYPGAVRALVGLASTAETLNALLDKGLIRTTATDLPGHEAFTFDHVLVRDAAYSALPKVARADMHEAVARWLAQAAAGSAYDGFVGRHLESASLLLDELEVVDERTARLRAEASARLEAAGRQIWMTDRAGAADLLGRADRLRDGESPSRWALQVELALALRFSERFRAALELAERVAAAAAAAGDEDWQLNAALVAGAVRLQLDLDGPVDQLADRAEEAVRHFAAKGDHWALMRAHLALSEVANCRGRTEERLREGLLAADEAERAGQPEMALYLRTNCVGAMVQGPTPADEAIVELTLWQSQVVTLPDRLRVAIGIASFATLLGSDDEDNLWRQARELEEKGEARSWSAVAWFEATTSLVVGRFERAEPMFRRTADAGETTGDVGGASLDAACLAVVLMHQGRWGEASEQVQRAVRLTPADDEVSLAVVHAAMAWAAAERGDRDGASRLVAAAMEHTTDEAVLHDIVVRTVSAEVAQQVGDARRAAACWRAALGLCERKGALAGARWCRSRLAALNAASLW